MILPQSAVKKEKMCRLKPLQQMDSVHAVLYRLLAYTKKFFLRGRIKMIYLSLNPPADHLLVQET